MKALHVLSMLLVAMLFVPNNTAADADYIGASKCRMCHKAIHKSWSELKHAKAFDLLPEAERGNEVCLGCHATGKSADFPGVQCEACHGPGGEYKSMKIMKDPEAAKAAGLVTPTEDTCKTCHAGAAPHELPEFVFEEARKGGVHAIEASE
jgi:nitrate/TMAO reductase-like tetraheme cytochrome c subunit